MADGDRPVLGRGFRLQWEPAQSIHVLLYPEGMVRLNASAAEILKLCDGAATVGAIAADLQTRFASPGVAEDVRKFLQFAIEHHWVEVER